MAQTPIDTVGEVESEGGRMMRANDIHSQITWPSVLAQLGIPESALRNKHGPCPACGGKDRFRFDNKNGRGTYYCNGCGAGDGFQLLERVHGWPFVEARKRVMAAAGLRGDATSRTSGDRPVGAALWSAPTESAARPSRRVLTIRRDRCAVANCRDAIDYLDSRGLWPLPTGCTLSAHATVEYWDGADRVGRYPALVADVTDADANLVTVHVTYLRDGQKLVSHEPRKILSPLTGRSACAVRLMPAADVLGIAEGIETALSASVLDGVPVWAALNATLLAKFEPPPSVSRLIVYADRDEAGLIAALRLMERLQGRVAITVRTPIAPANDWNDTLCNSRKGGRGSTS